MGESSGAVPARPGSNLGVAPRDALGILSPSAISLRTAVCDRHHLQMRGRTSDGHGDWNPACSRILLLFRHCETAVELLLRIAFQALIQCLS